MYARYFPASLEFLDGVFANAPMPDERVLPYRALCEPARLGELLDCYAADQHASSRRAVASQWSKYFFSRLTMPTLVLQMAFDRALRFDIDAWQVRLGHDGLPTGFVIADQVPVDDRWQATGSGCDIAALIDDALAPVASALCREARLSIRVFWSNAAMYFLWALDQLESGPHAAPERLAEMRRQINRRRRPDGGMNPFYNAYKPLPAGARDGDGELADQCRRLCCVRDLDPVWAELCANCPRAVRLPEAAFVGQR